MTAQERLEICLFILAHYPPSREMEKRVLLSWVDWYLAHGLLGLAMRGGKIAALGMARCLHDARQYRDAYAHFEDGPVLWVELQICQDTEARKALWHCVLSRLGCRKWVAHGRYHRGQERMWLLPFIPLTNKIFGGNHEFTKSARGA